MRTTSQYQMHQTTCFHVLANQSDEECNRFFRERERKEHIRRFFNCVHTKKHRQLVDCHLHATIASGQRSSDQLCLHSAFKSSRVTNQTPKKTCAKRHGSKGKRPQGSSPDYFDSLFYYYYYLFIAHFHLIPSSSLFCHGVQW